MGSLIKADNLVVQTVQQKNSFNFRNISTVKVQYLTLNENGRVQSERYLVKVDGENGLN